MKISHLFTVMMKSTTAIQKYLMAGALWSFVVFLLGYHVVTDYKGRQENVTFAIAAQRAKQPVRNLVRLLPQHQMVLQRFLASKSPALKNEVSTIQGEIQEEMRKFDEHLKGFNHLPASVSLSWEDFQRSWGHLRSQTWELSPEASYLQHEALLEIASSFLGFATTNVKQALEPPFDHIADFRMPFSRAQRRLSLALVFGEQLIQKPLSKSEDAVQFHGSLSELRYFLTRTIPDFFTATSQLGQGHEEERIMMETALRLYQGTLQEFLDFAEKDFQGSLGNDFTYKGTRAVEASFNFWNIMSEKILIELYMESDHLKAKYFLILSIAFLVYLITFCFGYFCISNETTSIHILTDATVRFSQNDLTARAQVFYSNEIDDLSAAFNKMAETFEVTITHLRHLLDAIERLSRGDFTARVSVDSNESEVGRVAVSFNKMASFFEELIGQMQHMGVDIASSATQISASSKLQEEAISDQEIATRQISVTASRISATVKEFAIAMEDVGKVADQTSNFALTGRAGLTQMELLMKQMMLATGTIASKLAVLNEKAHNITSIITTITKVAKQIDLLSLNAAIESEKAGEYGRSFAVIATEIRQLADRTSLSVLDIEKIVGEMMKALSSSVMGINDFTEEIRTGVEKVGKVGDQLNKIMDKVGQMTDKFDDVSHGMQAQATGAEQITEAISHLSQNARQTTESVHQFCRTVDQLHTVATQLKGTLSKIEKEATLSPPLKELVYQNGL